MYSRPIFIRAVVLAILIGVAVYFYVIAPQRINPSSTPSPTPFVPYVFSPQTQFVPKGAESREVDQSLAAFGFPKPLPFFEKDNVVQSLSFSPISPNALPSLAPRSSPREQPSTIFLTYRIFGQSNEILQSEFVEYFKNMGWQRNNIGNQTDRNNQPLIFFSPTRQIVSVAFLDEDKTAGVDKPAIIAVLSMPKVLPKP